MSRTETIHAIKAYLDKRRNLYRCGDCLANELHMDRAKIEEAIGVLGSADEHVCVEDGECGLCNESKECVIMQ